MTIGASDNNGAIIVEPGVVSSYSNGWRQLWKHFWELLLAGLMAFAITAPVVFILGLAFSSSIEYSGDPLDIFSLELPWGYSVASYILQIIYIGPIIFGLMFIFMKAARGENAEINGLFQSFKNYGNILMIGVLYVVLYDGVAFLLGRVTEAVPVLGALLTVVWVIFEIIIVCKLIFVPYLLLDRKMEAIEAVRTSWKWTNGHAGKVFLMLLLAIPIGIIGVICLIIGIIPAAMWIYTAFGSLYHAVSREQMVTEEATPVNP